jgi:hypothetical protein
MSSDRQQQITSVFHPAIEREGTERRAFLDGDHRSKIGERVRTRVLQFFSEKLVF